MQKRNIKDNGYEWYENHNLHREDGPAVILDNGVEKWYFAGKLHRVGGPAETHPNGSEKWYTNNQLHRENGPAVTKIKDGKIILQEWYEHDKLHRLDGPAVITENGKQWYYKGNLHRLDGPAVMTDDGGEGWYNYGKELLDYEREFYMDLIDKRAKYLELKKQNVSILSAFQAMVDSQTDTGESDEYYYIPKTLVASLRSPRSFGYGAAPLPHSLV